MERMNVVRYNGNRDSYRGCSDPSVLVVGKEYVVQAERDMGWQTNYTLQGVPGEFNSVWFDPVEDSHSVKPNKPHTFIAATRNVPVVGQRLSITRIEFVDGALKYEIVQTSRVNEVSLVGDNIYRVQTHNSIYMMLVQEP